jgi:hypothetical protein
MANYVGAITNYNPYIQQIPTEAYMKVGMYKEQQYQAGVQKVQENIDKIAGLDIANEGGRQYLRSRVDELTNTLNKYSHVDFSNPNNVTQLTSLAKPLYQDENIVNDVINTGIYRKWQKEASDAFKAGKMMIGQYTREATDASVWLNSQSAGAQYTGRQNANTATKKDLVDRIIKTKKDGMEKSEYVYDINYDIRTPYYVKSTNKHYSEAEFNNFVTEAVISSNDREMLMNENWYENQGKATEQLQQEDLQMYQAKIVDNVARIDSIKNDPLLYAGDKKTESQQKIKELENYNYQLINGKVKYLQELNLNDPTSRDVFHRDIAESRFVDSLDILRDEVRKQELEKNDQWFLDKQLAAEAARAASKAASDGTKVKAPAEIIDEVAVYTPVDATAAKTSVNLNTINRGYTMANQEINLAMNSLMGKLQENGVDLNEYVAGWDQVQTSSGNSMSIPRFKSPADKDRFYKMVSGLNFAYTKEAEDGKLDNHSFTNWVKQNFSDYQDDDPNSKFTLADKVVSDALNNLKGTSALLPRLESLFADKGVTRTMAQIDESLKNKKDMANAYRAALLKSNALTTEEMRSIRSLGDDELLDNSYNLDTSMETKRYAAQGLKPVHSILKDADGSYSIVQTVVSDPNNIVNENLTTYGVPETMLNTIKQNTTVSGVNVLGKGYRTFDQANEAFHDGNLKSNHSISNASMKRADEYITKNFSYVQENLNSTVQNLKNDKPSYAAVQDGLTLFATRGRTQATPEDFSVENGTIDPKSLTGISKMEVLGASINNTTDIFNPNPVYEVQFTATTGQGTKEEKTSTYDGKISLKSFLATNPNFKTSEYAKYFAPFLYAKQDAYAHIKSATNPLEGAESRSYSPREDIEPVFTRTTQAGDVEFNRDDPMGNTSTGGKFYGPQIQWETLPIERDGRQTMVSYQVVSLGQDTQLGNIKSKGNYEPNAYYVKLKVPTSTGEPKVIFLKKPSGDSYKFNSASYAHYTVRDLIFNNPEVKFDDVDQKTGNINYLTADPTTIRGIFNAQLSYNGHSKLEPIKIKDAIGNETIKQQISQSGSQFVR